MSYDGSAFGSLSTGRKVGLGGCVLATLGAFLPWFSITFFGSSLSVRGIDRDGKFTLLAGVIAAAVFYAYWKPNYAKVTGLLGLFIGGLGLLYIFDPLIGASVSSDQEAFARSAINIGVGLYFTAAGGIAVAFGSYMEYTQPESGEQPTYTT